MPLILWLIAAGGAGIGIGSVLNNATETPPIVNTSPQPVQPPSVTQTVVYVGGILAIIWAAHKVGVIK